MPSSIDLELLFNAFILNHIAKIQELQIKITILAFVFTYVATLSVFFISLYELLTSMISFQPKGLSAVLFVD